MQKWYDFDSTRWTWIFGFADYESGERRGSDADSHFGCMINLLFILFWIYDYLLILFIEFIIDYF